MLLEAVATYENGTLKLDEPLPLVEHERVTVRIESQAGSMSREQWRAAVLATAGKWEGDFQRPEEAK